MSDNNTKQLQKYFLILAISYGKNNEIDNFNNFWIPHAQHNILNHVDNTIYKYLKGYQSNSHDLIVKA